MKIKELENSLKILEDAFRRDPELYTGRPVEIQMFIQFLRLVVEAINEIK